MKQIHTKNNIDYIEKRYNVKVSKFMQEVLEILSITFGGLHHTDVETQWKGQDYTQTRSIEYEDPNRTSVATYDYSDLTTLVILAHLKGIRISVGCVNNATRIRKLCITFSNTRSEDHYGHKHPSLKEAIKRVKSYL